MNIRPNKLQPGPHKLQARQREVDDRRQRLDDLQQAHGREKAKPLDLDAAKRVVELREQAQAQPKNHNVLRHFREPEPGSRSAIYNQALGEYRQALGMDADDVAADKKAATRAGLVENVHSASGRLIAGSMATVTGPVGVAASNSVALTVTPLARGAIRVASKPAKEVLQQGGGTAKLSPNITQARNPDVLRKDMAAVRGEIRESQRLLEEQGPPALRTTDEANQEARRAAANLEASLKRAGELDQEYIERMGAGRNRLIGKSTGTVASYVGNGMVLATAATVPPFTPLAAAGSAALSWGAGIIDYRNAATHAERLNMKRADFLSQSGRDKLAAGQGAASLDPNTDIDREALRNLRIGPVTGRVEATEEVAKYKLSRYQEKIDHLENPGTLSPNRLKTRKAKEEEAEQLRRKQAKVAADLGALKEGNWRDLNPDGAVARSMTEDFYHFRKSTQVQFDKPGEFRSNVAEGYHQVLQTAAVPAAAIATGIASSLDPANAALKDANNGTRLTAAAINNVAGFPTDDYKNTVSKQAMGGGARGRPQEETDRLNRWKSLPGMEDIDLSGTGAANRDAVPNPFRRALRGLAESAGGVIASFTTPFHYQRAKSMRGKMGGTAEQGQARLEREKAALRDFDQAQRDHRQGWTLPDSRPLRQPVQDPSNPPVRNFSRPFGPGNPPPASVPDQAP